MALRGVLFPLLFLVLMDISYSDYICDAVGTKQIIGTDTVTDCIDFMQYDGDTIPLYDGITRIGKNGLALCPIVEVKVETPDIVYILDQSKSMKPNSIIVKNNGDTIISFKKVKNTTSVDSLEIRWENGYHKLPVYKNINGNWAGDPYGQAAISLHKTIEYQASKSPLSTASFLGFYGSLDSLKSPPVVLNNSNLSEIISKIRLDRYNGGTAFANPLKQAKKWLLDTTLCKNEKKLIIFISDGRPTDKASVYKKYLDSLNSQVPGVMPPIYGIFLGEENASSSGKLEELADTTGGEFYRIPPQMPDSLVCVLRSIIEKSFAQPPLDLTLENRSLSPLQSSKLMQSSVINQVDGSFKFEFDSIIALIPGINHMEYTLGYLDAQGKSIEKKSSFYLNVGGLKIGSDTLSGFDEICFNPVDLKVKNDEGYVVDTLTDTNKVCCMVVDVEKRDVSSHYKIMIVSEVQNDTEFVNVSGGYKQIIEDDRVQFYKNFDFECSDTVRSKSGNDTVEAAAFDKLFISWFDPRDYQDYDIDTIIVRGESIVFKPVNASLFDSNEDGYADYLKVVFDSRIPAPFGLDSVWWNKKEAGFSRDSFNIDKFDSNNVCYTFLQDFDLGVSSIPGTIAEKERPIVKFSSKQDYKLSTFEISLYDSVAPSILNASLLVGAPTSGNKIDTLEIEVSELLKDIVTSDPSSLLRISYDISYELSDPTKGFDVSQPLKIDNIISVDSSDEHLTLKVALNAEDEIKNRNGVVIYLNRENRISDLCSNIVSRRGVPLSVVPKLFFTKKDSITDRFVWPIDSTFGIVFISLSKSSSFDTISGIIYDKDGDSENVLYVETSVNSGVYKFNGFLRYSDSCTILNDTLEAVYENKFKPDSTLLFATVNLTQNTSASAAFFYNAKEPIEPTEVFVKNSSGSIVKELRDKDSLMDVNLDMYRDETIDSIYNIKIITTSNSDTENLQINFTDTIESMPKIRYVVHKKISFISNDILKPTSFNSVVETSANDTIILSWYSLDGSDMAFDTLTVKGKEILYYPNFAFAYDNNQNGRIDCVKAWFDKKLPIGFFAKSLSWPSGDGPFVNNIKCEHVDTNVIVFNLDTCEFEKDITAPDYGNLPSIVFSKDPFYKLGKDSVTINDSVGVVPVSATVYRSVKNSHDPDTLLLKLSENSSVVKYSELLKDLEGIVYDSLNPSAGFDVACAIPDSVIKSSFMHNTGRDMTFIVSKNVVARNSVLFLNDNGSIFDKCLNFPGQKGVLVRSYGKLFLTKDSDSGVVANILEYPLDSTVTAVWKIESITDSIDTLTVKFCNMSGDVEAFNMVETEPLSGVFICKTKFSFSNKSSLGNGVFEFSKFEDDSIWAIAQSGTLNSSTGVAVKYYPSPRITVATYYYSPLASSDPDTLRLSFNTPVLFYDNGSDFTDFYNHSISSVDRKKSKYLEEHIFVFDSTGMEITVERTEELTPLLDSIRFSSNTDAVFSLHGVKPLSESMVPIRCGNTPEVKLEIVPNPIGISSERISMQPIMFDGKSIVGVLARVTSRVRFKDADMRIYDVAGSLVKILDIGYDGENKYLYSIWDLKNSNGRFCGAEDYIFVVKLRDTTAKEYELKKILGVKDLDARSVMEYIKSKVGN